VPQAYRVDYDLFPVREYLWNVTGEMENHFYRCERDAERGHGLESLGRLPIRTGLVGLVTVGASVCSVARSRRLRRQGQRSFELEFDLNRRKTAHLVRPTREREKHEESIFQARSGKWASLWTVEVEHVARNSSAPAAAGGNSIRHLQEDAANVTGPHHARPNTVPN